MITLLGKMKMLDQYKVPAKTIIATYQLFAKPQNLADSVNKLIESCKEK
jgi:hypothetical protein